MSWLKMILYSMFFGLFSLYYFYLIGGSLDLRQPYLGGWMYVLAGILLGLSSFKASEIVAALRDSWHSAPAEESAQRYQLNLKIFQSMGSYGMLAGAGGCLLGIISALANLDTVATLTTALATALLPLLYGLGLRFFVFYPFEIALTRKQIQYIQPEGV